MANGGFRQVAMRIETVDLVREVAEHLRGNGEGLVINRATGEVTVDSAVAELCRQWLAHRERSRKAHAKKRMG